MIGMAAIYRKDKDGKRIYVAKDGGETTDRKQARKYKGCAMWACSVRMTSGDPHDWYCDCNQ